jgi:mono/diheme cytochrome c family protein
MPFIHWKLRAYPLVVKPAVGLVMALALGPSCLGQTTQAEKLANVGAKKSFERLCQGCHGTDGKGDSGPAGIPDFTRRNWQERKEDAKLVVSILEGKGSAMPAFGDKLSRDQAKQLMMHIRSLAPNAEVKVHIDSAAASTEFAEEFGKLQEEYQQLRDQLQRLSSDNPGLSREPEASKTAVADQRHGDGIRAAKLVYRDRCQKCHGADGKGVRDKLSCEEPPNFACREWQEQRSDVQLIKSISDGKASGMPAFRKHLSEEQVRDLVEYIRNLTPPRRASSPKSPTNQADKPSPKKEDVPAPQQIPRRD